MPRRLLPIVVLSAALAAVVPARAAESACNGGALFPTCAGVFRVELDYRRTVTPFDF